MSTRPEEQAPAPTEELAPPKGFTGFIVGALIELASFELLLECPKKLESSSIQKLAIFIQDNNLTQLF